MIKDLAYEIGALLITTPLGFIAAVLIVFAVLVTISEAARRRRTAPIENMPGHPERVRPLDDPIDDGLFGDLAEELLDDGLAHICEQAGWMR